MLAHYRKTFIWTLFFLVIAGSVATIQAKIPVKNGARILFIGNSYTGTRCALPEYIKKAFISSTPAMTIATDTVILWGKNLRDHITDGKALSKIKEGGWDVVVLQGYNDAHSTSQDTVNIFFENIRTFNNEIKKVGATTVLYMPWAYNPGSKWFNLDRFKADSKILDDNYSKIAREIGAPVVPVGQIWYELTINPPKSGLAENYLWYVKNGKPDIHQSVESSCINAWAFYSVLRSVSPAGVHINTDFCPDGPGPSPELESLFQKRVWEIIQSRQNSNK